MENDPFRLGVLDNVGGAFAAAATLTTSPITRPLYAHWGATTDEITRALPGDEIVPHPTIETTRAITIAAPPDRVWPWIVQLGYGRGGLYSYEALEQLAGSDLHNADRIHPEWQNLKVGDTIALDPRIPAPYTVLAIEGPGPQGQRALILGILDEPTAVGERPNAATWVFFLDPLPEERTRLLVRGRHTYPTTAANEVMWRLITDPLHFVMERQMLMGIKERAEAEISTSTYQGAVR